jgi:hypothetical protein
MYAPIRRVDGGRNSGESICTLGFLVNHLSRRYGILHFLVLVLVFIFLIFLLLIEPGSR